MGRSWLAVRLGLACIALAVHTRHGSGFYIPGVAPNEYKRMDPLEIKVSSVYLIMPC